MEIENIEQYILNKCEDYRDVGCSWIEVANKINLETGLSYSDSYYRKKYKNSIVENVGEQPLTDDQIDEITKMKMLKVKLSDERIQTNAYIRRLSREQTFKEMAEKAVAEIKDRILLQQPNSIAINVDNNKEAILCLSDWHYGIVCDNYWNHYDLDIAKQRIQNLRDQVIDIVNKENIGKLNVLNLGDLICGRIHLTLRLESRIDVITQTMQVCEILAEFLNDIQNETSVQIDFHSCSDNHSRVEPDKTSSLDLESFSRFIPFYLKQRLLENRNIKIVENNVYDNDIVLTNVLGHNIAAVHGHNDAPGKVADNLTMMTKEKIDLILIAHFHHWSGDEKNEIPIIGNGSLMGTDTYAKNLRLTSTPSQNMVICTKDNPMYAIYRITL